MTYEDWDQRRTRLLRILEVLAEPIGCSDGLCKVTGPAQGAHTNGGCRCYRELAILANELSFHAMALNGLPWMHKP